MIAVHYPISARSKTFLCSCVINIIENVLLLSTRVVNIVIKLGNILLIILY